ncbi:presqualene diphosphate synthase HpnD [Catenulispora subtropica]|uniref:Presqualene diphosphate synthase HpnD n=1 Tax=Catenulispora subtropica TaxID=450798 RepID=A0ABN2TGG1_9ACTN
MDTQAAYDHCEQVVRARARNFAYGIRLLPTPKRQALSAVYAFARRIDDVGDGDGPAGERLAQLGAARADLHGLSARPEDPVLVALADTARRFPVPLGAFDELIDGCEADVRGVDYATADQLTHYCRCVAGSIGRLSLGVYGVDPARFEEASGYADSLGVALQLTNILRDIREDGLMGRVYLPADALIRFGCTLKLDEHGRFVDEPADLAELLRDQAARARTWYDAGLRLLPLLDRRSAACTAAMAGIYRRLLDRIAEQPISALNARMSLPGRQKAAVAVRALAGMRP